MKMEDSNLLKIHKYGDDILKLKANEVENLDGKMAVCWSKWSIPCTKPIVRLG